MMAVVAFQAGLVEVSHEHVGGAGPQAGVGHAGSSHL